MRTTNEVLAEHLKNRKARRLEEDLINYAADVVTLTSDGIFQGHDGLLQCARLLQERLSDAEFRYRNCLVSGEVAFREWTAQPPQVQVQDGVDTFFIRDGRIEVQTIHYCPIPAGAGSSG
jgi:hypothetical protein